MHLTDKDKHEFKVKDGEMSSKKMQLESNQE
jgi:hypothetical protein